MLTIDELAAFPLFSALPMDELMNLFRAAADIHLRPGEYTVHEGEEPALYAVLSGKIEVTKLIDGIESVVGARVPGQIFGEVPLVYGTQFQSSGRASEPSRVDANSGSQLLRGSRARRRSSHRPSMRRRASGSAGCRASPPSDARQR